MRKSKRMTTRLTTPLTIAGVLALTLSAPGAHADGVRLLYSQWLPARHFTQKIIRSYFKDIEKATQGRVRISASAKALGPPPRQLQLAIDGVADVAWGVHSYQPGVYPLAEMVELPFVSTSVQANSVAYWKVYQKHFAGKGFHPKGVHTLALHVNPPGNVYNNKRPILHGADMKGLKLRATNRAVFGIFRHFGAVAISPAGGVLALNQGLAKGVMDGTTFTDDGITTFHLQKYIKFATHVPGGLYNTSFYLVINQKKWDAISAADRKAISALGGARLAGMLGATWDKLAAEAAPKLRKAGVKIATANKAFLAELKTATAPIQAAWIAKAAKMGVDGAAALKMYRALSNQQ